MFFHSEPHTVFAILADDRPSKLAFEREASVTGKWKKGQTYTLRNGSKALLISTMAANKSSGEFSLARGQYRNHQCNEKQLEPQVLAEDWLAKCARKDH